MASQLTKSTNYFGPIPKYLEKESKTLMEIPSTTNFDFSYKEAIKFWLANPSAKLYLEQGICPYLAVPLPPDAPPPSPDYLPGYLIKTIWPVSFGRLHQLELLIEDEEDIPGTNGKRQKCWRLDRVRAAILEKARGRPAKDLAALVALRHALAAIEGAITGNASPASLEAVAEEIREWLEEHGPKPQSRP